MKWTDRQIQAAELLNQGQFHTLLYGGTRSGKTFLICSKIATRAMQAPGSRHGIVRLHFSDVKQAVVLDTWPHMMKTVFPEIPESRGEGWWLSRSDWYATLPGGSEVWFAGTDDKERIEKILGKEYATVLFNECSQLPYSTIETIYSRLAQKAQTLDGRNLPVKAYYDENPPRKGHWSYSLFFKGVHPVTKQPLPNPEDYAQMQINPTHNEENLTPGYVQRVLDGLSPSARKRFRDGEFSEDNPNALFSEHNIESYRTQDPPRMIRVVVGVDPSGAGDDDNIESDDIGIVVAGVGVDGNGYILEDCTVKEGPAGWGKVAATAYDRHLADAVVGEINYGGAMVEFVVRTASPNINFKAVTASRGKVVRAEPISALYHQGRIRHAGSFPDLEDEYYGFSTAGYTGDRSPNRADAAIWALTELFPQVAQMGYGGKYNFSKVADAD